MEEFKPSKIFNNANKIIEGYHLVLQPLCKKTGLPPVALDILLFVANNPENATAKEMCKIRGFKSGIVSVHIDRLVVVGYLERFSVPNDRRKVLLRYTEKAKPIVLEGQSIQKQFVISLLDGVNEEEMTRVRKVLKKMENNLNNLIMKGSKND